MTQIQLWLPNYNWCNGTGAKDRCFHPCNYRHSRHKHRRLRDWNLKKDGWKWSIQIKPRIHPSRSICSLPEIKEEEQYIHWVEQKRCKTHMKGKTAFSIVSCKLSLEPRCYQNKEGSRRRKIFCSKLVGFDTLIWNYKHTTACNKQADQKKNSLH